jgi:hypothetical protein
MKKILLFVGIVLTAGWANAQLLTANTQAQFATWSAVDVDGDGENWAAIDLTAAGTVLDAQGGCAISHSWDGTAGILTPDNLFATPPLNLTGFTSIDINFSIGSVETTASGWYEEYIEVYVVTTVADALTATAIMGGILPAGGVMLPQTVNSTLFAGSPAVYVVFRHFNCTDENYIVLDDVTITGNGGAPCLLTSTATSTAETVTGANDGTATAVAANGTPPYTYAWTPSGGTGATATGLAPGTYTVLITDALGCTSTSVVTVAAGSPCIMTATAIATGETSAGANDGTATATAVGGTPPFTYSWAPFGGTGATATGLSPGSYYVTITDGVGCSETAAINVIPFTCTLTATATSSDVLFPGASNGSGTVTAIAGTAPYTYSWAPTGGTASFATGLAIGTYTVTISDAGGCSVDVIIIINDFGCNLSSSFTSTDETSYGANDGSATATAVGGTAPYTYIWSPTGGGASTATGLAPGTYTVIIFDAAGCASTSIVTINGAPFVSVTEIDAIEVNAYPNPTSDNLTISSDVNVKTIKIISLDGKILSTNEVNSNVFTTDVSRLNAGMYFYQLETDKGNILRNTFMKK